MPVPGIPKVRRIPLRPTVTWAPRTPKLRLGPDFETFTKSPGKDVDAAVEPKAPHLSAHLGFGRLLRLLDHAPAPHSDGQQEPHSRGRTAGARPVQMRVCPAHVRAYRARRLHAGAPSSALSSRSTSFRQRTHWRVAFVRRTAPEFAITTRLALLKGN
jgi:hypothetical protein